MRRTVAATREGQREHRPARAVPTADVLQLQRMAGNRAVTKLAFGGTRRLQRFNETEHKLIGDTAWGSEETFELAPGFRISFGDAIALGDYFDSFDDIQRLAAKEGKGPGTRGELMYVLRNKIWNADRDPKDKIKIEAQMMGKQYDKYAKHRRDLEEVRVRAINIEHFPFPEEGDLGKSRLELDLRRDKKGKPVGGGAKYRVLHEEAIERAWQAGSAGSFFGSGRPALLDEALLREAYACHFLSDAFSASHANTPRASIKAYWNAKVPSFDKKMVNWLSKKIAKEFPASKRAAAYGIQNLVLGFFAWIPPVRGLVEQAPGQSVEGAAHYQLMLKMGGVGFGDLISLVVHDHSGEHGVKAKVEGKDIDLVGDGGILNRDKGMQRKRNARVSDVEAKGLATFEAATGAVKASIIDVQDAYVASATSNGDLKTFKEGRLHKDLLWAGERMLPTTEQKPLFWKHDTVDALLADQRMNRALADWGVGRAKEMEEALLAMPEDVRKAVRKILLEPLGSRDEDRVRAVLREIIDS
jgi:hypothetical protein